MEDKLVVAVAADDRYAMPLTVMIRSLLENIGQDKYITLYILEDGIKKISKKRLINSLQNFHNITFKWISPDKKLLSAAVLSDNFTIPTYFRILLPVLLPATVHRVIYLDCDIVVNVDLSRLWKIDLQSNLLAAAKDINLSSLAEGIPKWQEFASAGSIPYFNAGVLVIDLEKWRQQHVTEKLLDILKDRKACIRWVDQDVLNMFFIDKWKTLERCWNQQSPWLESPLRRQILKEIIDHPRMVHFSGATLREKPWHPANDHPLRSLYDYYLNMTEWRRHGFFTRLSFMKASLLRYKQKLLRILRLIVDINIR